MKGFNFKDFNPVTDKMNNNFQVKIHSENQGTRDFKGYKLFTFPGGEEQANFSTLINDVESVSIRACIKSSSDVMRLFMLTDAIRRDFTPQTPINLVLPYVPYARQDRACGAGDCFGLKVFCDLLNTQKYDRVIVLDPHSDVAPALIDNVVVVSQLDLIVKNKALTEIACRTIPISPDAGANKKVQKVSEYCTTRMIRADKLRNVATGKILETIVYASASDLNNSSVTIYDDICDGGRTFTELAKVLKKKGVGWVNLFVTHGIFSKGYEPLFADNLIDHVFTTDSLNPTAHKQVTIIPVEEVIKL